MMDKYFLCSIFVVLTAAEANNYYKVTVDSSHGVDNTTCCTDSNFPCNNLEFALQCVHQQVPDNTYVTVLISEGDYILTANQSLSTFEGWSKGITIKGTVPLNNESGVIITCEDGAGLSFNGTNNITLQNVQLSKCGRIHDSTSRLYISIKEQFLKTSAAVYFLLCENVTIVSTVVTGSNGTGIVMYNTVGNVTILKTHFMNNSLLTTTQVGGGGGLYIEFGYCIPGNSTCFEQGPNVPLDYTSGARYLIAECFFEHNVAAVTETENDSTFILPQKSNHLAFGRGGGLSVFFKGITSNTTMIVNRSFFGYNHALWGGGIFVEFQDNASSNLFHVHNTVLDSNYLFHRRTLKRGTGGGGTRVGFLYFSDTHAYNNSVLFDNCTFVRNIAYFGGGLSFYTAREPQTSTASNSLVFTRCQWRYNVARAGSAVDLSVWHPSTHGALTVVLFEACIFDHNTGNYTSVLGKILGIGAMYLDSIPIILSGNTTFHSNTHSALGAVNTGIYFNFSSYTSFVNNSGHSGGAISLMGFAFIEVKTFSSLIFINNSADIHGGAVFGQSIGQHDLISSRNCFIRYYDIIKLPEEWECKFYFEGNIANGRPNSIYATSLLPCLWGTVYGSVEANASQVFCWNSTVWNYSSSSCISQIAISPAKFNNTQQAKLTVYPGLGYKLPVIVLDDRLTDVTNTAVFTSTSLSPNLQIDRTSEYISDHQIKLHGVPNKTGSFALNTIEPRIVHTEIIVDILHCPLGMIEKHDKDSNLAVCKCAGNYGGLVHCDSYTFNTSVQRGYWIGLYTPKGSKHSTVAVGACPYCSKPQKHSLSQMCDSINRYGPLCGRCKSGYCPSNDAFGFVCADCSTISPISSWFVFVFRDLGLIVLLFLFVFIFDVKLVSARANALVFFAQVIPVAFTIDATGSLQFFSSKSQHIVNALYIVPLNVFNLNFQWFPICLSHNMSSLTYISLGYVTALFPLLLIATAFGVHMMWKKNMNVVRCLLEPSQQFVTFFQQKLHIRPNIVHAFATFLQLSYTKFTLVSFNLLNRVPLYNDAGHSIAPGVVYYDGTLDYLQGEHVMYFAIALVVILLFVIPPPLILLVGKKAAVFLKQFIRKLMNKENLDMGNKRGGFAVLFEAFTEEFKDGTDENGGNNMKRDMRWFSGLYFALRSAVFAVYALGSNRFMQFVFQQVICVFAIVMFAILRPYKDDFYNNIDTFMFAVLIILNTSTMYNFFLNETKGTPSKVLFIFQLLVIIFYVAFSIGFIFYRWKRRRNTVCCWRRGMRIVAKNHIQGNIEATNLVEAADNERTYGAAPTHLEEDIYYSADSNFQ